MIKIFLIVLFTLFSLSVLAYPNEAITKLDSGRYVYFDGNYWVYVWLNDMDKRVNFLIKSIYRPEQYGFKMLKETKEVEGEVVVGATVK